MLTSPFLQRVPTSFDGETDRDRQSALVRGNRPLRLPLQVSIDFAIIPLTDAENLNFA